MNKYANEGLLFGHIKSYSHTIVLLADVANGLQILIAAECRNRLQESQQFVGFEKHGDATVFALGIAVGAKQHGLQCNLGSGFIEGVGAFKGCA